MVAANVDLAHGTPVKIKDVMKRFGVSRGTVEGWFANGLPARQLGRFIFTTLEAIQDFSAPYSSAERSQAATRVSRDDSYEQAAKILGI